MNERRGEKKQKIHREDFGFAWQMTLVHATEHIEDDQYLDTRV
jgi:hypothetical protein